MGHYEHVEQLVQRISNRITERKHCVIFQQDIRKHWPVKSDALSSQKAAIKAFAEANGWQVTIHDPGIRATFRNATR